jgi:hypothetical protein
MGSVATFVLSHTHEPAQCSAAFAAWRGFDSPLRSGTVLSSCVRGGHRLFWCVEADDVNAALAQLPPFVAERTEATEVREVAVP